MRRNIKKDIWFCGSFPFLIIPLQFIYVGCKSNYIFTYLYVFFPHNQLLSTPFLPLWLSTSFSFPDCKQLSLIASLKPADDASLCLGTPSSVVTHYPLSGRYNLRVIGPSRSYTHLEFLWSGPDPGGIYIRPPLSFFLNKTKNDVSLLLLSCSPKLFLSEELE